MEFDFNRVGGWLDLTSQEFEILKNIYRLDAAGGRASPKTINSAYAHENNKTIQKQNLHKILRKLVDSDFVARKGQGEYTVSLPGIQTALAGRRQKRADELSNFEQVTENIEEEFHKHLSPTDAPYVEYLASTTLYDHIAGILGDAVEFNIVANFPSIAYPPNLAAKLDRSEYSSVLAERCLSRGILQANFLTDLDVDHLFVHCFRVLDSPGKAFKLASNILNNIESMAESDSKVDVRYHPDPHGLDVAVPIAEEPQQFYLFTRDEHQEISGGIYVKSRDSSRNALQSFRRSFDYAERDLTKHLETARNKLAHKYGILGK